MLKTNFRAMGCDVEILSEQDDGVAEETLREVLLWIRAWESIFSRFDANSELSLINQQPGVVQHISDEMSELIELSLAAEEKTQGLFSPIVLKALEQSGYINSFEKIQIGDNQQPFKDPVLIPSAIELDYDPNLRTLTIPPGSGLDLGGLVKGWTAEQIVLRADLLGGILVNIGGDIACCFHHDPKEKWEIKILDPNNEESILESIFLDQGAVATSGTDFRHWLRGEQKQHHIIDPRTGVPAQTDVLTATIITRKACDAEIAAKTALILGMDAGLDWLNGQQNIAGYLVKTDGSIRMTNNIRRYLE